MRQGLLYLLVASLLFGCTSIPLSSISKLSSLDPATADFIQMEVAVRVEDDYLLYKDGTLLILTLLTDAQEPEVEDVRHKLVLQPIEDGLTTKLEGERKKGFYLARFRVNPNDEETVQSFREEVVRRRAAYPNQNSFNITAGVNGCFKEGANPFRDQRYSVYLRRSAGEDYFTLFRETKLPNKNGDGDFDYCETGADARPLLD